MKHYRIYNSPINSSGETLIKIKNPYPKVLIKEGLTSHNHQYEAFENESTKNASVLLNPVDGKREYLEYELKAIWQFFDIETERWLTCHKEPSNIKKRIAYEFIGDKI